VRRPRTWPDNPGEACGLPWLMPAARPIGKTGALKPLEVRHVVRGQYEG
jgi:hypothetical protein